MQAERNPDSTSSSRRCGKRKWTRTTLKAIPARTTAAANISPRTSARYDHETGEWVSKFKKFDYVFKNPLSKALAKEYVDSLKK